MLLEKSFYRFWTWRETFSAAGKKIPGDVLKATIYKFVCKIWGKKVYWNHSFLSSFPDHDQFFSGYCRKTLNQVIIIAYYVSKVRIWKRRKKRRWRKIFRLVKKKLPHVCQNSNPHVHRISLKGRNFLKLI